MRREPLFVDPTKTTFRRMSGLKVVSISRQFLSRTRLRYSSTAAKPKEAIKPTKRPIEDLTEKNTKVDYAFYGGFALLYLYLGTHTVVPPRGLHTDYPLGDIFWKCYGKYVYRKNIRKQVKESKEEDRKNGVGYVESFYAPWRMWLD